MDFKMFVFLDCLESKYPGSFVFGFAYLDPLVNMVVKEDRDGRE